MCGPPVQYTKYLHALTTAGATSSLCKNITRNNKREWQLGISRVDERDLQLLGISRVYERDLQLLGISRVDKRVRVAESRETTNVIFRDTTSKFFSVIFFNLFYGQKGMIANKYTICSFKIDIV